MSGRVRVFVYGTLRRGEANHHLLGAHPCLAVLRTEPCFELVSLGSYPALVTGGTTSVVGEVYEVDAGTLCALDELEGHPYYYQRRLIALDDGSEAVAYVFSPKRAGERERIPGGDWLGR